MSQTIEQNKQADSVNTLPLDANTERMSYQEFVALNEAQSLSIIYFTLYRKAYKFLMFVCGCLLGFCVVKFDGIGSNALITGVAIITAIATAYTFLKLRRAYTYKRDFLLHTILIRKKYSLMRDQDKQTYLALKEDMNGTDEYSVTISTAKYTPYTQVEIDKPIQADLPEIQGFKHFTVEQFWHLYKSLLTCQLMLERYAFLGISLIFLYPVNQYDYFPDWVVIAFNVFAFLNMGYVLWSIRRAFQSTIAQCVEGKHDESMATLNAPKKYTFLKVGDHLAQLVLTGLFLIIFVFDDFKTKPVESVLWLIMLVSVLTIVSVLGAMRKAVKLSNAYDKLHKKIK